MLALTPGERPIHTATMRDLFSSVQSYTTLENGYAFSLPNTPERLDQVVKFVSQERLCCPFFGFSITIEPEDAGLWLHVTGREGVKPFIVAEFGKDLPPWILQDISSPVN